MRSVSSAELNRDPARYQEVAAQEPVAVVDRGETKFYVVPAPEYERLKRIEEDARQVWSIEEMPEDIIRAIISAPIDPELDRYNHEMDGQR